MNINILTPKDISQVMELFCKSFFDDHYYAEMFPDVSTKAKDMTEAFQDTILYCISKGASFGVRENEKLIGFTICFDYKDVRDHDSGMFRTIFAGKDTAVSLPYDNTLHSAVSALPGKVMYCLSLAVDPAYQRTGIASAMWDCMISKFPNASFAADISNSLSLEIYRRRNFKIELLDEEYYLITHIPTEASTTFAIDETVKLIVPDTKILRENEIEYTVLKEKTAVSMAEIETRDGYRHFVRSEDGLCFGTLVSLAVDAYLRYQRAINVAHYTEIVCSEYAYYIQNTPYTFFPLKNDTLKEMIRTRGTEWSIIPDVFVSIPVQYDRTRLDSAPEMTDIRTQMLLRDLDFRTHYEAGIPSSSTKVDDLAGFKHRIKRRYLGKLPVQITCENTVNQYDVAGNPIGEPVAVDMYLAVDEMSGCGVLTWYSLSSPFLISQLLDNVIRNQVLAVIGDQRVNLFDHLDSAYGLIRRGTPKSFVVIPKSKSCLTNSQIASLLASETIYPDGETYGEVIDPEITAIARSEYGMGQYSRAYVAAYTNVVLQFNDELCQTLRERLYEESITLFYIELILFEEASINIADREIMKLLTAANVDDPIDFLQQVDRISGDYAKTIDFWDVQVNYPTSQKSINMLRDAFEIKEKLEYMKRDQEQLQVVFGTKCDIIDRKDAKRMDKSLAILSILAVFSAWIDGYDYVSTWDDLLSGNIIYIIQKVLFVAVLITAIYAVTHLFGGKAGLIMNIRRARKKRRFCRRKRRSGGM